MKKIFTLLVAMIFATGFSQEKETIRYSEATVSNYKTDNGKGKEILVFIFSKPTNEFKIIGNVKMKTLDNLQFKSQIYFLTLRAVENYPFADAIIIDTSKNSFTADVIEFIK